MKAIASNDIFAKVLSTENITIRRANTATASFDCNHRVLTLPVFQKEVPEIVEEMFISHEVGHALWTDAGDKESPYQEAIRKSKNPQIMKGYMNILEDVRIEKLMKQKYPGLRKTFTQGYAQVVEAELFEITKKDPANFVFIDRINMFFKFGQSIKIPFSDAEREYLPRIFAMNTMTDVINMANELMNHEVAQDSTDQHDYGQAESDPDGEGEPSESGPSDRSDQKESDNKDKESDECGGSSGESEESDEDGEETSDGGSDGESDEDGEETSDGKAGGDEADEGEEPDGEAGSHGDEDSETDENSETGSGKMGDSSGEDGTSPPEAETDEAFNDEFEKLTSSETIESSFVSTDDGLENSVVGYKDFFEKVNVSLIEDAFNRSSKDDLFEKDTKKLVDMLAQEFEMKKAAEQLSRSKASKTGRLDVKKLYAYKIKKDLFKTVTVVPDGKNHGLVILLDWSGSMQYILNDSMKQVLALVEFCRRVGIPHRVYITRGHGKIPRGHFIPPKGYDSASNIWNSYVCAIYEIFSNEMSSNEFRFAKKAFGSPQALEVMETLYPLSNTPMAAAVLKISNFVLREFNRRYNIEKPGFVIVTDGEDTCGFSGSSGDPGAIGSRTYSHYNYGTGNKFGSNHHIVTDLKTKCEYDMSAMYGSNRASRNPALDFAVQLLKDRFNNIPVAVFNILDNNSKRNFERSAKTFSNRRDIGKFDRNVYVDHKFAEAIDVARKEFNKKNSVFIPGNYSYDALFFVKFSKNSNSDNDLVLKEGKKVTPKSLGKALTDNVNSRKENRFLLSRFVGLFA